MRTRDYKKEYEQYHGTPAQIKRRAGRNSARRYMVKQGLAKRGDGKDVDHRNFNTTDNRPSNLRIMPKSQNRKRQG
jgi:hypothetical protein|tara:strand:- start:2613 stop:2840 length:228 start_codon:yes stop_codon:yes gene_type:complete